MVNHDLCKSPNILELLVLLPQTFSQVLDILSLVLDDLFVVEFEQLFFLFKIMNNLLKRLLKNSDLFLENFDFLLLCESSLFILISGALLDDNISLLLLGITIERLLFSLIIVESISLTHRLFGKLLVFKVNVSLDFLDVSLGILDSLLFELLNEKGMLFLHLLFHAGLFNFDFVLFFLDGLLQTLTILLPSHQL